MSSADTCVTPKISKISSLEDLNDFISERDNRKNISYLSDVPNICKEQPCILGIDEAGRGPVLGPMVYGIAICSVKEAAKLESLECADSKTLNEETRDKIFAELCKTPEIGWGVEIIAPNVICNSMLQRNKHSLNEVSMDSAIGLIRAVETLGVNISHIYVDTVGPPEKYQSYLSTLFPKYGITVAKKADSIYPIVSAASICAKVTRDHALQVWKCEEIAEISYKDFGSGYPSDPVTKKFLKDNCEPVFGFPQLVRFSWSTASRHLQDNAYHVEFEEVDEKTDAPPANTLMISDFFKKTSNKQAKREKHEFFRDRCLNRCTEF